MSPDSSLAAAVSSSTSLRRSPDALDSSEPSCRAWKAKFGGM
jgi:hypothetical protein